MALDFTLQQNLTTDTAHNVPPLLVKTPFICEEPDSTLYQYFIEPNGDIAQEKKTTVLLGQYDDLPWADLQNQLSISPVSRIGIKHFPHIGAIGFYKDKYTGLPMIAAPIHVKTTKYTAPVIDIVTNTSSVTITITPPEDVSYTCYKVIMRSGYFAYEYVTYETPVELPLPAVIGTYTIYAVGYNETTGICSMSSNIKSLTISTGRSSWDPDKLVVPMALADLTDVNLVDLLNAQSLRYNSTSGKWENACVGDVFTVTLEVGNWTGSAVPYEQTIALAGIVASGYSYIVTPDDDSWYSYGASGIYMKDPTTDGSITFNATSAMPAVALTVNILKVRAS